MADPVALDLSDCGNFLRITIDVGGRRISQVVNRSLWSKLIQAPGSFNAKKEPALCATKSRS